MNIGFEMFKCIPRLAGPASRASEARRRAENEKRLNALSNRKANIGALQNGLKEILH
jgi:hypothetical protein